MNTPTSEFIHVPVLETGRNRVAVIRKSAIWAVEEVPRHDNCIIKTEFGRVFLIDLPLAKVCDLLGA